MAESVEFQLKLQDQMSAALHGAAGAATKLEDSLKKTASTVEHFGRAEHAASEHGNQFERILTRVYERFLAWKIVEFTTTKVLELGRALVETTLEVTDFGYQAEVALRHLNNETEGAAPKTTQMLAEIKQFALDAGQPLKEVEESFLGLKRAGLSDEWVRPLTAAAGDLAALGGHPENFRPLLETFEQISLRGELTGLQLRTLSTAGISPAALAAKFGAKDFRALQEQLEKTPIPALQALRSIEELIKQTAHENKLGETFKESTETFAGGITRIKDLWEIMLEDLNEDPIFKSLRADFTELVNTVVGHKSQIEQAFKSIVDPIIQVIDKVISNPEALKHVFDEALVAAGNLGSIVMGIGKFLNWASQDIVFDLPHGLHTEQHQAGHGSFKEFTEGSREGKNYDFEHFAKPSSYADGGPVHESGFAMVHAGEFVIPAGGAKGGGHSVNAPITINVHVEGGGDGMTEEGLSLQLRELLPGVLVPAREQLATTVGAA